MQFREWLEQLPEPDVKKQPFKTFKKAKRLAHELKNDFENILKKCANGHRVITDIKSKKSFHNKTADRGKSPSKVFDILRGAILVDDKPQVYEVLNCIKKHCNVKKIEHKDIPDNKFGYHGPIHVDIILDDMVCEVQIATHKCWQYKGLVHPLYAKNRGKKIDPLVSHVTKELYKIGNS